MASLIRMALSMKLDGNSATGWEERHDQAPPGSGGESSHCCLISSHCAGCSSLMGAGAQLSAEDRPGHGTQFRLGAG